MTLIQPVYQEAHGGGNPKKKKKREWLGGMYMYIAVTVVAIGALVVGALFLRRRSNRSELSAPDEYSEVDSDESLNAPLSPRKGGSRRPSFAESDEGPSRRPSLSGSESGGPPTLDPLPPPLPEHINTDLWVPGSPGSPKGIEFPTSRSVPVGSPLSNRMTSLNDHGSPSTGSENNLSPMSSPTRSISTDGGAGAETGGSGGVAVAINFDR